MKSKNDKPGSKRGFRQTPGDRNLPVVSSGASCRREDDRRSETELGRAVEAAVELDDGSGAIVGARRSFLDREKAVALRRVWR